MKRSEVAYLGVVTDTTVGNDEHEAAEQDDYGVWHENIDWRKVYVGVRSVSATEFFEGGKNGFRPEWRFTLFRYDYGGEHLIDYDGNVYEIYRTYNSGSDEIELYAERRLGNE